MILVLVGKSSSGKDTLQKELVLSGEFNNVISTTSRPIREGEIQNVDYYFVSKEEFRDKIEKDKLLEYRTYETLLKGKSEIWYYGTEKKSIDLTKNSVLVLDLGGLAALRKYFPDEKIIGVYLHCPTALRTERAKMRGSFCNSEWNRRLKTDKADFENVYSEVDYVLNSSKDTSELVREIREIREIQGILCE